MKIAIMKDGGDIRMVKDYSDVSDRGEVAHIICELEIAKLELLEIFKKVC